MLRHSILENRTAASGAQISTLLDVAREVLILLDRQGSILFMNESVSRILGYHADEIVGRSIEILLHADERAAISERLECLRSTPCSWMNDLCQLRARDGSWRWFETNASVKEADSAPIIALSCLDVTELHRMEAERQVISDIVRALNQTANLDQLLARIHQALKKVMFADNCFVALHDCAKNSFQFPFFVHQSSSCSASEIDKTYAAFVFKTGRAQLAPPVEFMFTAELLKETNSQPAARAWLGVPLKTPTATIGVLAVKHYENENAYDIRDLEFLDSVGGHIALAIERRSAEDALRKSESMFRLLFEHNPLPTWVYETDSLRFLQVNDAVVRQYGYTRADFESITALDIRPEADRAAFRDCLETWNREGRRQGQTKHLKKDGTILNVEVMSHLLEYAGRKVRLVVAQDVGERQLLEQQLRQAQKMEAVGRLAGGIAHDFNNLLMVIKGHTELLMNAISPSDPQVSKIEQIEHAAQRAVTLTRQLLAFSRMQVLQPRVLDLGGVVEDMGKLLPRLIGEDIELVIRTSPDLGRVRADASQMEQVIMNLAVNARDAMPTGGLVRLETSNADLDNAYSMSHPVMRAGRYVLLSVSDTGMGMDAETQARIFEPFFTTKEMGKGTGLGLATVYGVVKQSGGFIWVDSELGKGTTFKIYLPRVDQALTSVNAEEILSEIPRCTDTILLAEDERDVREVAREFLESGGYTVIEASNAEDAMRLAAIHGGTIRILVTDMVMPGMTGQELATRLRKQSGELRVVYMSGYSEYAAATAAQSDSGGRLLTKPFNRNAILHAVREVVTARAKVS